MGSGKVWYQQRFQQCGKPNCSTCTFGQGHGPYWYAKWREGPRIRSRYLGKDLPPGVVLPAQASEFSPPPGAYAELGASQPGLRMQAMSAQHARISPREPALPEFGPPALRVWTLGQFRVDVNEQSLPATVWRRKAAARVLKLLLLHRHLSREQIGVMLYPDADTRSARRDTNSAVYALRTALEPIRAQRRRSRFLVQEGHLLCLRLGPNDWVDFTAFEEAAATAAHAVDPLPLLKRADELYGGDLLPEEDGTWCISHRESLRLRWQQVLLRLATTQQRHALYDEAMSTLQRLLAADPAQERAALYLMNLHHRRGQRAEALRVFTRLETALRVELGIVPSQALRALERVLRDGSSPGEQDVP